MEKPPAFFVPEIRSDEQEAAYAHMAEHGRCGVPALGDRVYSVTFGHNGIVWTATVGRSMRGVKGKMMPKKVWKETPVVDATVIAAIFPSHPYIIFHTGGRSPWENPFMAGDIRSVTKFSVE
ncbi:hypothetical protein [Rhizorhabdus argentea]|uniref:hypothetical protein n=1 Tax=Rhizorhabdus argentea TaxID=1387174 RepID=UPI0030EB35E8